MKWEQYRSVMERYAIKTDDMATEDAYFMSTHMPFSSLELFRGGYYEEGKMPAPTKLMSADRCIRARGQHHGYADEADERRSYVLRLGIKQSRRNDRADVLQQPGPLFVVSAPRSGNGIGAQFL